MKKLSTKNKTELEVRLMHLGSAEPLLSLEVNIDSPDFPSWKKKWSKGVSE